MVTYIFYERFPVRMCIRKFISNLFPCERGCRAGTGRDLHFAVFIFSMALISLVLLGMSGEGVQGEGRVHNLDSGEDFDTIQAALDNATDGDEIHADSGIYHESLVINRSVILRGNGTGQSMIQGVEINSTVLILSDNVTLSNFTITGSGNNGTMMDSGVLVSGAFQVTLEGLNCTGNRYGLAVIDSINCSMSGIELHLNRRKGLFVDNCSGIVLSDSIVDNNSAEGGKFYDSIGMLLKNTLFYNNTDNGCYLGNCSDVILENVSSLESYNSGFMVIDSTDIAFTGCNSSDNLDHGVRTESSKVSFTDFTATGNYIHGIFGIDSSELSVQNITLEENLGDGLHLSQSSIVGNGTTTVRNSGSYGIYGFKVSGSLAGVTAENCSVAGISFMSSVLSLSDSILRNNTRGVRFFMCEESIEVRNITIHGSGEFGGSVDDVGVQIEDCGNISMERITIIGSFATDSFTAVDCLDSNFISFESVTLSVGRTGLSLVRCHDISWANLSLSGFENVTVMEGSSLIVFDSAEFNDCDRVMELTGERQEGIVLFDSDILDCGRFISGEGTARIVAVDCNFSPLPVDMGNEIEDLELLYSAEVGIHFVSADPVEGGNGSFRSPWDSIGTAVEMAVDDDIIILMDGIHPGGALVNRSISIMGLGPEISGIGTADSGENEGNCLVIQGTEGV